MVKMAWPLFPKDAQGVGDRHTTCWLQNILRCSMPEIMGTAGVNGNSTKEGQVQVIPEGPLRDEQDLERQRKVGVEW